MAARGYETHGPVYCSVPDGALDAWYAARAQTTTHTVPVVIWGDSIAQGFDVPLWDAQSWLGLTAAALQGRYGAAGRFISCADSAALAPSAPAANLTWTLNSSSAISFNGMIPWGMLSFGTTSASAVFTSPTAFTACDLLLPAGPNGGGLSVAIDGVAQAGPFSCQAAQFTRRVVYSLDHLPSTPHTVAIATTGASDMYLGGISLYPTGRSTPGIFVAKHALQSRTSADIVTPYNGGTVSYDTTLAAIADWNPALFIYALGINDCQFQPGGTLSASLATYAENLALCCQAAQNGGASIVLLLPYGGPGIANRQYWGQYMAQALGIAHAYNAAVLNVHAAFGSAVGLINTANNIHPNVAGHALIARLLLGVL